VKKTIDTSPFRAPHGKPLDLDEWPTRVERCYESKRDYEKILARHLDLLQERQRLLYAHDRYSLLLIFQAMDAAGKDGAIRHVMSGINPQGCQVFSFKHPSAKDLDHDFLWRSNACLPERGRIGIFNRSYYEEVLIVRVEPSILAAQALPADCVEVDDFWQRRFESINGLERHLHRNGTRIVKFFLHLSKEEQRQRFLDRLEEPDKNWKFSASDLAARARWDDYMRAYGDCIGATSTEHAPWFVVPADDKKNARLIISQVLTDTIDGLRMRFPPAALSRSDVERIRRELREEDEDA
jgi:PPK2 family polyphosphate:nucleotide phosphotransferase